MRRAKALSSLLGIALALSGCETLSNYYGSLKTGDSYILILVAALVGMMVLFGTIARGREEILEETVIKAQKLKDALHEAEDQVRLKREALYLAQQELLGRYDKLLTEAQRKSPQIQAQRRKILELEREILTAEGRRNQLLKQQTTA
jgi:hypothetical protein